MAKRITERECWRAVASPPDPLFGADFRQRLRSFAALGLGVLRVIVRKRSLTRVSVTGMLGRALHVPQSRSAWLARLNSATPCWIATGTSA